MAETEAVLLQRFAGSGDAQALGEIIRRHAGLVYGAAWRILTDVDRASDVAQETFLQLMKDANTVTGSLPGWLHRVATHKAIDQQRRDASRRRRERQYAIDDRQSRDLAEWKDISPHIDMALRELDPELRDVLILHFLQGRTTREIAAAQGSSQATVSRRIGAGVGQLRARLRRRGILVAVGALSTLLGDNAVQAAPLPLLTELGKMAMVGGAAATAGTGAGFCPFITGVLTVTQAKIVAVAAVAVLGAGSVVTYQQMTKPSSEPVASTLALPAAAGRGGDSRDPPAVSPKRSVLPGVLPEAEMQWDPPVAAGRYPVGSLHGEALLSPASVLDSISEPGSVPTSAAKYGGMMGSLMGVFEPPRKGVPEPPTRPGDAVDDLHGAGGQGRSGPAQEPNRWDSNDPGQP